jgi:hypothetical protein
MAEAAKAPIFKLVQDGTIEEAVEKLILVERPLSG